MESVLSSSLESSSSPPQSHVHMRMAATESATTTRAMYAAVSGPVVHVASIMSPHAQVKSDIALMTQGVNYHCSLGAQPLPAAHSPPSALSNVMAHGGGRDRGSVGSVGPAGSVEVPSIRSSHSSQTYIESGNYLESCSTPQGILSILKVSRFYVKM